MYRPTEQCGWCQSTHGGRSSRLFLLSVVHPIVCHDFMDKINCDIIVLILNFLFTFLILYLCILCHCDICIDMVCILCISMVSSRFIETCMDLINV